METELLEKDARSVDLRPKWDDPVELNPITSPEQHLILSEKYLTAKDFQKTVKKFFAPMKAKSHDAHREICKNETDTLAPAKDFEVKANRLIVDWEDEQERIRKAEELKLQEEARKREEEIRIEEAAQAEAEGKTEEAEAILNEPVQVPHVVARRMTQKVTGMASIETWYYELVDTKKLKTEYLIANDKAIGSLVRSLKKQAEGIVGKGAIRVYSDKKKRPTGR